MDKRSKREQFRKHSPEVVVEEKLTKLQLNLAIEMRRLRKSLGLTQKQLAERLEVGQSAISKLESADISSSFENVLRYLAALDADLVVAITHEEQLYQVSDRVDLQLKYFTDKAEWSPAAREVSTALTDAKVQNNSVSTSTENLRRLEVFTAIPSNSSTPKDLPVVQDSRFLQSIA